MYVCFKCQVINPRFYSQKEDSEYNPAFCQRRLEGGQPQPYLEASGNLQRSPFFCSWTKGQLWANLTTVEVLLYKDLTLWKSTTSRTATEPVRRNLATATKIHAYSNCNLERVIRSPNASLQTQLIHEPNKTFQKSSLGKES